MGWIEQNLPKAELALRQVRQYAIFRDGEEHLGTGLARVGQIVRRHGGQVWVETEPGEGATFYFTIGDMKAQPPMNRRSTD